MHQGQTHQLLQPSPGKASKGENNEHLEYKKRAVTSANVMRLRPHSRLQREFAERIAFGQKLTRQPTHG